MTVTTQEPHLPSSTTNTAIIELTTESLIHIGELLHESLASKFLTDLKKNKSKRALEQLQWQTNIKGPKRGY
jgi:hypothetical protein